MKKRVRIIIPYFGHLPKNMYSFLLSCKYNKNINWLIITDQNYSKYNKVCSNVNFVHSTLDSVKNKILIKTGLKYINLETPYKLCDYKPLYGSIFSKYLKNYDYWGYSDIDVVFGNILKYISHGINNDYDKIGINGHFTLFKNNKEMNNLYKVPLYKSGKKVYLFRDFVSQYPKIYGFDEFKGINRICKQNNISTYCNRDLVNDLLFENLDLNTNDRRYISKYSCYIWNNGHAQYYYEKHGKIHMHEYGYFHFQKRLMFSHFISYGSDIPAFSITTRGYLPMKVVDNKSIKYAMTLNKSGFLNRLKYILHWYLFTNEFTHKHIGKIYLPIKYVIWRIVIRHDFKI